MKATPEDEFADAIMRHADESPFEPYAMPIPEGDCIEFFIAPDDYYAERIDDLITVYYSRATGNIVGSLVKGVSGLCARMTEKCPGFGITVDDQPVRLEHLFLAGFWSGTGNKVTWKTYRKLAELAEEHQLEADCAPA